MRINIILPPRRIATCSERSMYKGIKAIVFDMDGTLFNDVDIIVKCWSTTLQKYGFSVSVKDIYEAIGLPAKTILSKYISDEEIQDRILRDTRKCFDNMLEYKEIVDEELYDMLEWFRNRKLLLGVATSSSCKRTYELLKQYGLIKYMDAIECVREGVRGKPYPDLLLNIQRRLSIRGCEIIYVGDTYLDYITAMNAGTYFILLRRRWSRIPSSIIGNILVINSIGELKEIIL
jgi:phosphoglycolate phosphatase